jgi:hypothetical protein
VTRLLIVLSFACGAGCAFQHTDEAAPSVTRTLAPAAPPPISVADHLTGTAPQPGRYEMAMHYHQFSSCSQSWASYDVNSTLRLDLDPRGRATACRSREANHTDPDAHYVFSLQHAYQGTWRRDGAWVAVDLEPTSDPACPDRPERPHEIPLAWHLQCIDVTPAPEHPTLHIPALACRFTPEPSTETTGYAVENVIDHESKWMLLGPTPGLTIQQQDEAWSAPTVSVQRRVAS